MPKKFITYPRSGNHFLQRFIILYTGGSHASYYSPDHDRITSGKIKGCLYVWRNPVDVLYSLFAAEFCNNKNTIDFSLLSENWLDQEMGKIERHLEFYWKTAGLIIRYKDLIENKEWRKLFKFLGIEYNEDKVQKTISEISLEKSVKHYEKTQWMNDFMLTDEYKNGRIEFTKKYEDKILKRMSSNLNKDINYLKQL